MTRKPEDGNVYDPVIVQQINELLDLCGEKSTPFERDLVMQIIQSSLMLLTQGHETGQLKMITAAMKEFRYAFRVFNQYKGSPFVSLFGSARTPTDHPDYEAAKAFGRTMAERGWMIITGGGDGVMRGGLEDAPRQSRIGLSIRLPFEQPGTLFGTDDPRLITFRYFFTRKVMFLTHSDAVAAFPGGVGTQDELFEAITLFQTGKAQIVPIVLLEGEGGTYWEKWETYFVNELIGRGMASPEDVSFFYRAPTVANAMAHIEHFYRRFHSSRYVKDLLVLRLLQPLTQDQVDYLNKRFRKLISKGEMELSPPLHEEDDHLDLPRLIFHHTRHHYGVVRQLIDAINDIPLS